MSAEQKLFLGDWRDTLKHIERCDVVLTDPPYSDKTHKGQRGTNNRDDSAINYKSLTQDDVLDLCHQIVVWDPWWVVIFCDHIGFGLWENELQACGLYTFAPVAWVRPNMSRFSGDGPSSCCEFICVARPKRELRDPGSRPGKYLTKRVPDSKIIGEKDLIATRGLMSDYSKPGDVIIDPYAGTGTTLLAAKALGRSAYGSEINPEHFKIAQRKISTPTTQELFL